LHATCILVSSLAERVNIHNLPTKSTRQINLMILLFDKVLTYPLRVVVTYDLPPKPQLRNSAV